MNASSVRSSLLCFLAVAILSAVPAYALGGEDPGAAISDAEDPGGIHIPEPMLFDLVRPLGARRGELEANTLMVAPWFARNSDRTDDPFGSGPTTRDRQAVEWAPEIEYAVTNGFAIEFEFPFEGSHLEEYKLGLQWTAGTGFGGRYIHGLQMLVEPTTSWKNWSTTLMYVGGARIDETWSTLFMVGGRMDLEGSERKDSLELLANVSIFADLTRASSLGVEVNYGARVDGSYEVIFVPQLHRRLGPTLSAQVGLGFGAFTEGAERSAIARLIWTR